MDPLFSFTEPLRLASLGTSPERGGKGVTFKGGSLGSPSRGAVADKVGD